MVSEVSIRTITWKCYSALLQEAALSVFCENADTKKKKIGKLEFSEDSVNARLCKFTFLNI